MDIKASFNEDENINQALLYGDINHEHVLTLIEKMIELTLTNKNYSWLVDYSNARFKLGNFDIYNLPKEVSTKLEVLGEIRNKIKRAIVRINDLDDFAFLYNMAIKEGQNLKVFSSREEALSWLKNDN